MGANPPREHAVKTVLHMIETGGTGGAETVYVNIVRGLDATRWQHVPVLPVREWMYEQLVAAGVQPVMLSERGTFDVAYFARMVALIRKRRVDLIHAHLFGSAVRAALLSRISGVPAIATLHGNMDLGSRERFLGAKIKLLNSGLKRVVFVSEPLRRTVLDAVPLRPDLAEVIPNGIDAARFASGDGRSFRAEFGIAPDEFVVGTVATPGRAAKGLDIFLEVAALLRKRLPRIRFVIVGDLALGRGTELLEQRAALGLDNDVIMTGFREDVAAALASFDVYALTSRTEGFSISLVEAMASGLPVVSTRCGGPEQILKDGVTGLLVENESATAVASAIERFRANPEERRRLGSAARVESRERFSLDAQLRSYDRLYQESTGGSSHMPGGISHTTGGRSHTTAAGTSSTTIDDLISSRTARISVVIPAYNRADFIKATVETILAQSLPPVEIIIVDDGSTDHTPQVCAQFGPPVRYIRHQNEGPSGARNHGIRAATGDWIAFCDSDDLWDRDKLELQMAVLDNTKAAWCISDLRVIDPSNRPVRPDTPGLVQAFPVLQGGVSPSAHFARWLAAKRVRWNGGPITVYHGDMFGMLFLGNIVLPTTAIVSRELIERAGPFDVEFRRAEDTEFFHRIAAYAPGAVIMKPLASYRVGHPSFMKSDPAPFIEYTLRSLDGAASRRPALSAAERAAYRDGRSKLRQRLAYTRLSAYDGAGARRAVLERLREDRRLSPRDAAIMIASVLPGGALRALHSTKRTARRLLG